MESLSLLLHLAHLLLVIIVILTDLTRRKVYRWWSLLALAAGSLTAATSPLWPVHVATGAAAFGVALWGWRKEQWGGGDVWFLTYLGLTLGLWSGAALVVGLVLVMLGLATRCLKWQEMFPLAALLGIGMLVVLSVQLAAQYEPAQELPEDLPVPRTAIPQSEPATLATLSPLPEPAVVLTVAQQAAAVVATVGLAPYDTRPHQARVAASTLHTLAAQTAHPEQQVLLHTWATALERFAAGDLSVLPVITGLSRRNQEWLSAPSPNQGDTPDAHQ